MMNVAAWITLFYGILVAAGGVIGYVKAASKPSLIMGVIFGLLLCLAALGMFKKVLYSSSFAILLTFLLDAFFSYRWFTTHHFIPAGMMSLVSTLVLLILLIFRFRNS